MAESAVVFVKSTERARDGRVISEVENVGAGQERAAGRDAQGAAWLKRRLFGIDDRETTCAKRGFAVDDDATRRRLEKIGRSFVLGYHAGLEGRHAEDVAERIRRADPEYRGFAFEGAGMSLALLDGLAPWRKRLERFLQGPGAAHVYMVCVGAGWAPARVAPLSIRSLMRRLDPVLGWLAMDGYGFHAGYFHWPRFVELRKSPRGLSGYSRRAFDQGLGRSLWFVKGAGIGRIASAIEAFPEQRRDDLFSGAGLACAYAGGADGDGIRELARLAGPRRGPLLAQGAAFGAQARRLAGNPAEHTELAARILCRRSADEAAQVTQDALSDLPCGSAEAPAYELWRRRIQQSFASV